MYSHGFMKVNLNLTSSCIHMLHGYCRKKIMQSLISDTLNDICKSLKTMWILHTWIQSLFQRQTHKDLNTPEVMTSHKLAHTNFLGTGLHALAYTCILHRHYTGLRHNANACEPNLQLCADFSSVCAICPQAVTSSTAYCQAMWKICIPMVMKELHI